MQVHEAGGRGRPLAHARQHVLQLDAVVGRPHRILGADGAAGHFCQCVKKLDFPDQLLWRVTAGTVAFREM